MDKAVGYPRVSSTAQKETGYSLPAQEKLIRERASHDGNNLVRLFSIDESASGKKQRKVFAEMMDFARKEKVNIIYAEKVDRITRNPKEVLLIQDWLDEDPRNRVIAILENLEIHQNARSHEKFVWDMKVAVARLYANNLSEEARKGIKEKIAQGYYHAAYKVGYMTEDRGGKKILIPHPTMFPITRKFCEAYMTGEYTLKKATQLAWDMGLRTRYGTKLVLSSVERIVKDPFLYGAIVYKGEIVCEKSEHAPLVTKEEFDLMQEIRARGVAPFYSRHEYLFSKMIHCGECAGAITSYTKKGHVYLSCNHYKDCRQKGTTRQEAIEKQLVDVMRVFEAITQDEAEAIATAIRQNHHLEAEYKQKALTNLETNFRATQVKIDRLYDDRLAGVISDTFWKTKHGQLLKEQSEMTAQIEKLKQQEQRYFETSINILDLARRASSIYAKRSDKEKRALLRTMFQSITLTDGKVSYELIEPVQKLQKRVLFFKSRPNQETTLNQAEKAGNDLDLDFVRALRESNPHWRFWRPLFYH